MGYDNTNSGALFPNKSRTTNKHPDLTGVVDVNGKEYRLAAWKNISKAGMKYLSLSVSEPYSKDESEEDVEEASDGWTDENML